MSDLLGVQMSEGTVCDLIQRCAGQLAIVEQQIKEALIQSEVIHQEETGLSVAGKRRLSACDLHTDPHALSRRCEPGSASRGRHRDFAAFRRDLDPRRLGIVLLVRL